MIGRSIRIFLPDGTPGHLFTAGIVNWTGQVTVFPRSELPRFLTRPEAQQPGVYLMLGQDPERVDAEIDYVGETEGLGGRLRHHDRDAAKEFWELTFAVSSKDANLTKSHVRYLEARLVQLLVQAGRVKLANGTLTTSATLPPLPEADRADMEFFLSQLTMLLPVVGFGGARPRVTSPVVPAPSGAPGPLPAPPVLPDATIFTLSSVGVQATAVEANGEFTVQKDSTARRQEQAGWTSYRNLRSQLLDSGKLAAHTDPELLMFTDDVPFRSTSAAAAVILGRNTNGRTAWKHAGTGQSYQDWKASQEAEVSGPESGSETLSD